MKPGVVVKELYDPVDLGFAALFLDGLQKAIDPPEQFTVLFIYSLNTYGKFFFPLHVLSPMTMDDNIILIERPSRPDLTLILHRQP
jgi:hypothetical protein